VLTRHLSTPCWEPTQLPPHLVGEALAIDLCRRLILQGLMESLLIVKGEVGFTGYLGYPFQKEVVKSKVSYSIALCLMYHLSEKGRDSIICDAFFERTS